jgi:hypothetical protein
MSDTWNDLEGVWLACLLRQPKAALDVLKSHPIKLEAFSLRKRAVAWVLNYYETKGKLPSISFTEAKFDCALPNTEDDLTDLSKEIFDKYQLARLSDIVEKAGQLSRDSGVSQAVGFMRAELSKADVVSSYTDVRLANNMTTIDRYRQRVKDRTSTNSNLMDSPWPSLNKAIYCFRPGDFVVTTSRLSIGKTWTQLYLAHHLADKRKRKVLFFSKEMSKSAIADRVDALRFKLNFTRLREGTLGVREVNRWARLKKQEKDYEFVVAGDESIDGFGVEAVVAKTQEVNPDVVFIDGAYLLTVAGSQRLDEPARMTALSRRLKALAMATNKVFFVSVQTNRKVESLKGKAGSAVVAVHGSDSWAQDADFLFGISGQRGSSLRQFDILKGRDSCLGSFGFKFSLAPPDFSEVGDNSPKDDSPEPTADSVEFTAL